MKYTVNFLLLMVWLIGMTACQQDDTVNGSANDNRPLTVTAKMPAEAWSVLSRSDDGITELTFHYTSKEGNPETASITNYSNNEGRWSFTVPNLVWLNIQKDNNNQSTFDLTCKKTDTDSNEAVEYKATTTATYGEAIFFKALTPTCAKLTVEVNVTGIADDSTIKITLYRPGDNNIYTEVAKENIAKSDNCYSASWLVAPHTLTDDDKVIFGVNDMEIPLLLSSANGFTSYTEGKHITLTVTLDIKNLTPGNIVVESFTTPDDGGNKDFNGKIE